MIDTVFITGTGRSGTNLLKDILSKHSEVVSLPFESRYTVDPDGIFPFLRSFNSWSPFIADKKFTRLIDFLKQLAHRNDTQANGPYADWELNKWIPGYYDAVVQLEEELCDFTYEARYPGSDPLIDKNVMKFYSYQKEKVAQVLGKFVTSCNDSIRKQKDRRLLIEDNTWSFIFSEEISRMVPDSMMIFMMRDPRDVICSMKKQRWTPSRIPELIMYYSDLMRVWEEQKKSIPEQNYIEIRFEDLIADSSKVLKFICDRLEIKLEEEMLESDMSRSNIGRYLKELDDEERKQIEHSLRDTLVKYDYL